MSNLYTKQSGDYKSITQPFYKFEGEWKKATVWKKVNGEWLDFKQEWLNNFDVLFSGIPYPATRPTTAYFPNLGVNSVDLFVNYNEGNSGRFARVNKYTGEFVSYFSSGSVPKALLAVDINGVPYGGSSSRDSAAIFSINPDGERGDITYSQGRVNDSWEIQSNELLKNDLIIIGNDTLSRRQVYKATGENELLFEFPSGVNGIVLNSVFYADFDQARNLIYVMDANRIFAVDKTTGLEVWRSRVDDFYTESSGARTFRAYLYLPKKDVLIGCAPVQTFSGRPQTNDIAYIDPATGLTIEVVQQVQSLRSLKVVVEPSGRETIVGINTLNNHLEKRDPDDNMNLLYSINLDEVAGTPLNIFTVYPEVENNIVYVYGRAESASFTTSTYVMAFEMS
ncbi:hypothetical protein FLK61_35105 [Paenalkalicoccus suaedae]|uniref:Uncharacterized protein n=1 Tax=Paenalkalicoccus suaedae TaxID=2592382 RepID=A0A859FGF3_9BACI|nr:hypothetical protein [Paenalkalicoccus suaedae]QKS71898.1 hypothetical protein FLK61_35105 [Paenalkalicoccus suaedae]